MRRFFFRPEERTDDFVELSFEQSHHIRRVLRLRKGTKIELFDGIEHVHLAEVVDVGERVRVRIIDSTIISQDDGTSILVGQGVLKAKNMDMVVQKYTELGVGCLVPLLSSRCQGRAEQIRQGKKHERWQKIIEESCKQCGRNLPMQLLETMDFQQLMTFFASGSKPNCLQLLFWEEEKDVGLCDIFPRTDIDTVQVLIGPEGGFSREEVDIARKAGWRTVSLGKRILRSETAALASVAILQYLLGAI